jgi:hypothetical protein
MSRQQELIKKFDNDLEANWETGLLLTNIPVIMLENDYVRSLCVIANAALLNCCKHNDHALHMFDISQNI